MITNDSENGEKVTKLMTKKSPVPNSDIKGDANSSQKASSDASRSKKVQANDMVIGKHYFNIGMREDVMLQDCYHSHMKHSFPDIDYAFFGYDLFRGYPLAHGHDPGFTFPIFHADYTNGKQTADCRYSVPKGLVIVPDVSCVTSFTSEIIENNKQLNQELSVHADAGGSGLGVEFLASVGYRQASFDLSTHKSVYIISSARCNYYFSKFQTENAPPFTDIFVHWIEKLNTTSSNSTYLDFFHTFGTHFPKEIIFGARYIYEHKMKSSLFEKKRNSGVNVKVQASTSGLIRVSGGFGLSKEQREEASEFSNSVETITITVGAAPPSNGDAMTWAASVQSNPVPSKYKLEPIENLFSEEYMGTLGVDYEAISVNLKALKETYYESLASEYLYNKINDMSSKSRIYI
ncbi:uncharacterized protein LOC132732658 [Ruditapes philippinarum]|uniref:uncharacterized protein LOC132732658 n=1 Tax=Ruditapes philippinarum TaxID=129788 RepID=UPI00295B5212|nr:uncharacterized protein LOC132732658 [Ruditapes philippinarum]